MNFKEYENIIKELEERKIDLMKLEIVYELKIQLEYCDRVFTDEEKDKMFNAIERAFFKSEDLTIDSITRTAIKFYDELDTMSTWNLIEEACYE